jgi:hypothetical protein
VVGTVDNLVIYFITLLLCETDRNPNGVSFQWHFNPLAARSAGTTPVKVKGADIPDSQKPSANFTGFVSASTHFAVNLRMFVRFFRKGTHDIFHHHQETAKR